MRLTYNAWELELAGIWSCRFGRTAQFWSPLLLLAQPPHAMQGKIYCPKIHKFLDPTLTVFIESSPLQFFGVITFYHSPVPELSFLTAPCRGWIRAGEKRVQDNLHVHAHNEPIKNHAARVSVSRNAFFSSRSKKKIFFDVDIVVKSIKTWKSKYGLTSSVPLSTTSTRH